MNIPREKWREDLKKLWQNRNDEGELDTTYEEFEALIESTLASKVEISEVVAMCDEMKVDPMRFKTKYRQEWDMGLNSALKALQQKLLSRGKIV